jgi:hypothetical protein
MVAAEMCKLIEWPDPIKSQAACQLMQHLLRCDIL